MPEILPSLPDARWSALEEFCRFNPGADSSELRCPSRMAPSIQTVCGNQRGNHHLQPTPRTSDNNNGRTGQRGRRPKPHDLQPPKRAGRRPGTSQYYGVRFRPDLNKWVAEIRVAEWKAVDKKVWLGTFETERAAARGVDLARKLLKCSKKHRPNLPCPKLEGYGNTIPRHLVLSDLATQSMFKEATSFIKHECKQYAASFNDSSCSSCSTQARGYNPSDDDHCDSELIQECGAMTADDPLLSGFEVDSYSMTPNYELVVSSSSSPSSCTSPGSCVTLGGFQGPEVGVPDWEVADYGDCGDEGLFQCFRDIPGMMPEVELSMAMMKPTLAEQEDASAASQQWGEDENSLFPWPVLMPDLASYLSTTTPLGYPAPGDSDPWMFQATHSTLSFPFQNGMNGWP